METRNIALILFALMFIGCAAAAIQSPRPVSAASEQVVTVIKDPKTLEAVNLPKYDTREQKLLTPVKEQGATETCWAFAANGAIEAELMKTGKGTWDLSEDNMIFGVSYKTGYQVGGNQNRAISYLSGGKGPVTEKDDPFDGKRNQDAKPALLLTDAVYLKNDRATIKEAVVKYGAVACSAYVPGRTSNPYYNTTTNGYYCPDSHQSNHNVDIVGWDDKYPKTSFTNTAPGDGAYIVRNSYGPNWGEGGYYYVSYYDTAIGIDAVAYTGFTTPDKYKTIYQNDPAGQTAHRGFKDSQAWFANVYTKQSTNETLAAVGFYTRGDATTYTVYLADNYTGPQDLKHAKQLKSGTIPQTGYHTIELDKPQALNSGGKFAVIIKLNTPGEPFPIATEESTEKTQGVTGSKGESFVSHTGEKWTDFGEFMPGGNVCLKVMVK